MGQMGQMGQMPYGYQQPYSYPQTMYPPATFYDGYGAQQFPQQFPQGGYMPETMGGYDYASGYSGHQDGSYQVQEGAQAPDAAAPDPQMQLPAGQQPPGPVDAMLVVSREDMADRQAIIQPRGDPGAGQPPSKKVFLGARSRQDLGQTKPPPAAKAEEAKPEGEEEGEETAAAIAAPAAAGGKSGAAREKRLPREQSNAELDSRLRCIFICDVQCNFPRFSPLTM